MSRATAIQRVRDAQTDWDNAIRSHEQVMPELTAFAARLRATSRASAQQAAALEYAAETGLRALAKDTITRHPPHELSPTANRPGNPQTWTQFDDAIHQWQNAWQSGSTTTVAQALRQTRNPHRNARRPSGSTADQRDRQQDRGGCGHSWNRCQRRLTPATGPGIAASKSCPQICPQLGRSNLA